MRSLTRPSSTTRAAHSYAETATIDEEDDVFVNEAPPEALEMSSTRTTHRQDLRRGAYVLTMALVAALMVILGAFHNHRKTGQYQLVQVTVQSGSAEDQAAAFQGCDQVVVTLAPTEQSVTHFWLLRRIDDTTGTHAAPRLRVLLEAEATALRKLSHQDPLQRFWLVDNLSDTAAIVQVLEEYKQAYTTHELPQQFWQAPLVFPADTDVLHQKDAYTDVVTRTLQPDVFTTVYQHKLRLVQNVTSPERIRAVVQQLWKNYTTNAEAAHLVQWGTFCPISQEFLQMLQDVTAPHEPVVTDQLLPTTPGSSTTMSSTTTPIMDQSTLLQMEQQVLQTVAGYHPQHLTFYNRDKLHYEKQVYQQGNNTQTNNLVRTVQRLLAAADQAIQMGPWSVMDKPPCDLLPSSHYYYSRSPYYWPPAKNDTTESYVKRPGYRVPGSNTHDAASYQYDRTRWYDVYSNTTLLALAWWFTDDVSYAAQAAVNVRTWFLDPATRMEPTLMYSHIRYWDHLPDDYAGDTEGHIDLVDVYYFMDAVRLIVESGQLTTDELRALTDWFRTLLHSYMLHSAPGTAGYLKHNNIGTYHDLLVMSVAAFVGDVAVLVTTVPWTANRLWEQVDASGGGMPAELSRPTCMHYQIYALEGWMNIARVSQGIGYNLWQAQRDGIAPLCQALEYVLSRGGACAGNIRPEDPRKLWSLYLLAQPHCVGLTNPINDTTVATPYDVPADLLTHFWNLGLPEG